MPSESPPPQLPTESDQTSIATARAIGDVSVAEFGAAPPFPQTCLYQSVARLDLLVILFFLVGFMAVSLLTGLSERLAEMWPQGGRFVAVPIHGCLILTVISLLLRAQGAGLPAIGMARMPLGRMLLTVMLGVPACYLAGAVSNVVVTLLGGGDFGSFARQRGEFFEVVADIPIAWVLPLSVFVGIYEEIVFRGFILSRLRAFFPNSVGPVIITSAVFGALHFTQGLVGMCQTAVVGLVLGIIAVRSRSIWPCILCHAIVDAASLLFAVVFADDLQRALRILTSQQG